MKQKSIALGAAIAGVAVAAVLAAFIINRAPTEDGQTAADQTFGNWTFGSPTVAEREQFRTGYADDPDELSEEDRAYLLRDQEWAREADFLKLTAGVEALASAWASSLEDPNQVLTNAQAANLLHTLAEHAVARGQSTPDMYIRLIDSDPHLAWNEADPDNPDRVDIRRRDAHVGVFYTWFLGEKYDPSLSTRSMLEYVWKKLDEHDHLIDAIGIGSQGARILVLKIRSSAEMGGRGLKGKYAPENSEYWWSTRGRAGMEFCRPVVSAEDQLADRPSLTVALVQIIVRLRDGRLGNWKSSWYLHSETGQWVLNNMDSHAGKTVMLVW